MEDPQFIVSGQSRFDVTQGALSDCCLSACASTLPLHEKLLHQVVPLNQGFKEGYAGKSVSSFHTVSSKLSNKTKSAGLFFHFL